MELTRRRRRHLLRRLRTRRVRTDAREVKERTTSAPGEAALSLIITYCMTGTPSTSDIACASFVHVAISGIGKSLMDPEGALAGLPSCKQGSLK